MTDDELLAEFEAGKERFGNGEALAIEGDLMLDAAAKYRESRRLPDGSFALIEGWQRDFAAGWWARSDLQYEFDTDPRYKAGKDD